MDTCVNRKTEVKEEFTRQESRAISLHEVENSNIETQAEEDQAPFDRKAIFQTIRRARRKQLVNYFELPLIVGAQKNENCMKPYSTAYSIKDWQELFNDDG